MTGAEKEGQDKVKGRRKGKAKAKKKAKSDDDKPREVSAQLAKIIGTEKGAQLSRPQAVKKVWAYISKQKLQDPGNMGFFTPDITMRPIFGDVKVRCLGVSDYLTGHLSDPKPS